MIVEPRRLVALFLVMGLSTPPLALGQQTARGGAQLPVRMAEASQLLGESQRAAEMQSGTSRQSLPRAKTLYISDVLKSGQFSMELVGDGVTTSQCKLLLINKANGQSVSTELKTACISKKTMKPPPPLDTVRVLGLRYSLGPTPPPAVVNVLSASRLLSVQNKFDNVLIAPERRQSTIAQLGIWQIIGGKDPESKDAISPKTVKEDLLKRAAVDVSTLTNKETEAVDDVVASICNSVDLTCKYSETLPETNQKKKEQSQSAQPPEKKQGEHPQVASSPKLSSATILPGAKPDTVSQSLQPIAVIIPAATTFVPNNSLYQTMMTTDETETPTIVCDEGVTEDGPKPEDPPVPVGPPELISDGPRLGVLLTRDDDGWLPKNPSETTLTAEIYKLDRTSGKWVKSDIPDTITFRFVTEPAKMPDPKVVMLTGKPADEDYPLRIKSPSCERGECMNHLESEMPDLYFALEKNPEMNCTDQALQDIGSKYFLVAKTKTPVLATKITVACEDFGAYGLIDAEGDKSVRLARYFSGKIGPGDEMKEPGNKVGKIEIAAKPRDAQKNVPRDENSNCIADVWEVLMRQNPKAKDDLDSYPAGRPGTVGDGMTAYEEYRGFFVMGEHHRTSWTVKDLFIRDQKKQGFAKYPSVSGVCCHSIKDDEWDRGLTKIVNFNSNELLHICEQHGIWLNRADLGETYGLSDGVGPPKNVKQVVINSQLDKKDREDTITHELGHATGMNHHGWAKSLLDNIEKRIIKPYGNVTMLNGKALTATSEFDVGLKHNNMSGDEACFMRYPNLPAWLYDDDKQTYVKAIKTYTPTHFCDSTQGRDFNAGTQQASGATNGKCRDQLVISDMYDSIKSKPKDSYSEPKWH